MIFTAYRNLQYAENHVHTIANAPGQVVTVSYAPRGGDLMNVFPLTKDHQKILDDLFSFSYFVHHSENVFSEYHDGELVEQYRRAWFDMEVINALALAEWESDGRPESWNVKRESMFKPEAIECLDHFLKIVSKF